MGRKKLTTADLEQLTMTKRIWHLGGWLALTACLCGVLRADPPPAQVRVAFTEKLGPMRIERMALGQGGLSEEPMLADRVTEIRALHPGIIRLFVQESTTCCRSGVDIISTRSTGWWTASSRPARNR